MRRCLEDGCCNLRKEFVHESGDGESKEGESDHDDEGCKDEDGQEVSLAAETEGVDLGVVVADEVENTDVVLEVVVVLDALDFTSVEVEDGDPDARVSVQKTNGVLAWPEDCPANLGAAAQEGAGGSAREGRIGGDSCGLNGALLGSALGDVRVDGGVG